MNRAVAGLASKVRAATSRSRQVGSRIASSRNYAAKDMKFGVDAGAPMLSGVKVLADAVKINMGPKILGYERTLPRWFSAIAHGGPNAQLSSNETKEAQKVVSKVVEQVSQVDGKEVTCFSPLESISIKPRTSGLGSESVKINRMELSQKITFALVPALLLISKSSLTTSVLVLSVYWQIYGFFKEILLDYVHQEVSRKWVLVYLQILLLILIKDTFLDFGLV